MADLGYKIIDADNHYYEAIDAFTRHLEPRRAKKCVQWVEMNGKPRLLVGGKLFRFIPNPTFDPVAKAGCLDEYYRGSNPESKDMRELFSDLEPIKPAYRDRDARLELMDTQNVEACLLFPTLGVGIEEALSHDADLTHDTLESFNRWLDEDWGFHFRERIFAAPMISLMDCDRAVAELEWALKRGVRVVNMRPAPVPGAKRRSPADSDFDPFWARVNEAGITITFHSGDSGYGRYAADWGEQEEMEAFGFSAFKLALGVRSMYDTIAALVCHGLFARFPRVRIASIENGAEWVSGLQTRLAKTCSQMPASFHEHTDDTLRRHVFVAPYYEDDIPVVAQAIGVDNVLLGSDFPHAEGLASPMGFARDLGAFDARDVRKIMRENTERLLAAPSF
jgi:predicted TIM-barrel fold metal-dependent hydrolase